MSARNLDKLFKPRRIALLGLREEPRSLGLGVLHNLLDAGLNGAVYPICAELESVRGVPTYPTLADLPHAPDLAVICNPAIMVPQVVEACGVAGVGGVAILSGGFHETGAAGRLLEQRVADVARRFTSMRVIGPNSLGIIAPRLGLNASHAVAMPKTGRMAFISQSRALCNSVLDWAAEEGIGFSYFVSVGNMLDVGYGDLIDYFASDSETHGIIVYMQSVGDARTFMSAARAFARIKPIVVYKAGRYAPTAHAQDSNTGALIASDAVYEAAFQRAGVVRVAELDDVFDVAELLASQRLPQGARLAIVGNAGGPALIATDALLARGGKLAQLEETTLKRLDAVLPPVWPRNNPVDLFDGAPPERYARVLPAVLEDPNVDAVLVIYAVQVGNDPTATAAALVEAVGGSSKPVLAAWMGGAAVREGTRLLNATGIPTHGTPEQAVRAFMHLVAYAGNLQTLYETPRDLPLHFELNRRRLRKKLQRLLEGTGDCLTECQAKTFLKAYGIPVYASLVANCAEEATELAARIGYPVALKLLSPQLLRSLGAQGIATELRGPDAVIDAYERIAHAVRYHAVDPARLGVTVQKMVHPEHGLELILGAKKDPTFGPVIVIGMGGVAGGVFRDHALGLPPLNERLVRRMLESLRSWPMLQGLNGRPAVHVERLIETVIRFSQLIADYPEILEFDVHPLLATAEEVVALDAAVTLDTPVARQPSLPYHHLSIRPYPEEYVRRTALGDDTQVTLRPIRPEDEPLWHRLVAQSSPESIRFRFRVLFRRTTHQMAVEHCVIDYEREIAIVAETTIRGERELIGVGRLVADVSHETAEYAVLVPDPWQGRGLGNVLLDYTLELARRWGIRRVVAETDPENTRMLSALRKRGFAAQVRRDEEVVLLEKFLDGAPYAGSAERGATPAAREPM